MAEDRISVPYNYDAKPLEAVLAKVRRPGDFFVQGVLETPLPRVEVSGMGVLSFPVPVAQIQQLIQQATRAPYGRGRETVLDESVRRVWQLPPTSVSVGGKAWPKTLARILAATADGLGCASTEVSAELYKLLVYDEGGFFKPHRDTEKTAGMFGTLVVVLPSAQRGGELIIRHAGREVCVELAGDEISELKFAAFYADCEHEVKPVTRGNRVCLVYNLIQKRTGQGNEAPLSAPLYDAETAAAAKILAETFARSGAPAKLAWLLEHHYSPAELSFAALKNADAALAKVLRPAVARADCAVHLGIVCIEENGPAELNYDSYAYSGSSWREYDAEGIEDDDASSEDFEVIEISDGSRHIDHWRDERDCPADFGPLPLAEGEVLPAGALDDEKPDEQRLMEATGNEGASFERSYRRAALVIWPRERFADVLLQSGVGAVLPHLAERIAACGGAGETAAALREPVVALAERILTAWENGPPNCSWLIAAKAPDRGEMLKLLGQLGETRLLERFISGVVAEQYDGGENEELAAIVDLLGAETTGRQYAHLARENAPRFHGAIVELLRRILLRRGKKLTDGWRASLREVSAAMVGVLPQIEPPGDSSFGHDWERAQKTRPADAAMVADLLECLRVLGATDLRTQAAAAMVRNTAVFDPAKLIVPALTRLQECERPAPPSAAADRHLWGHAAEYLLARSEQPPASPTDWRQPADISCRCGDCRALLKFAHDPKERVARFRVRKDRRQHLHHQIERHGLDMTHVTERKGSPQTLVCSKTRRTFQRQCAQHQSDCAAMGALLDVWHPVPAALEKLATRLIAAKDLKP